MSEDDVLVRRDGAFTTITMNRPRRRNALSRAFLLTLTEAFREVGATDARGVILAANGPVFSAGHDFADMTGASHADVRDLLQVCTELMRTIQSVPQVVVARVHGLATAAGCQLVASCDLAVAATSAGFATPGGKGGWFCHTPLVAISHNIGRKRAAEMALTGEIFDAATAADWGLINYAVPDDDLDKATHDLLQRATQGSPRSKALGKQAMYAQFDRPESDAYTYAIEVMAASALTPEAQEGMTAFLQKRPPTWPA
ncbi:enoyl-CoA hydratase/carnithine racemase [Actinomadura pelletieri DSM 43383]|uniref:Enoyl-CoA hydratase domain-containing protein 3, mitochondrial n=1 Tax=Actinomadura pelletieri DSM 43383 TaxID=1120940 RepID=A0A495QP69_9ACTN|nr:enoyl-CoA hydratase-related protein [Actinomadura pelletieri]RKS74780.1 enoyl-CoA hydratase/carnithine racemase [Actinomadura pelletieri DSM 43383]